MVVTEEDYQRPTCAGAGSLQTWRIGADNVIRNLDRWDVEEDPALSRDNALCSAHYFDEDAGLLAQGWYEQGTRFFDVTNPADIRQVGYWIPQKNVTWGAVFHPTDKETVYALDHSRGVDVLHVERFGAPPAPTVTPPPDTSGQTAPDNCASRPPTSAGGGCKKPPDQAAQHPGVAERGLRRPEPDRAAHPEAARARRSRREVRRPGALPLRRAQHRQRRGHRREGPRAPAPAAQAPARRAPGPGRALGGVQPRPHRAGRGQVARDERPGRSPGRRGRKIIVRARVTLRSPVPAPSRAARTAAMPTVRAPVTSGAPRQRYVAAYGLCRIVVRDNR